MLSLWYSKEKFVIDIILNIKNVIEKWNLYTITTVGLNHTATFNYVAFVIILLSLSENIIIDFIFYYVAIILHLYYHSIVVIEKFYY